MVYDVVTQKIDQIPSLLSKRDLIGNEQLQQCGIHSVRINPSRTLLATGARNTCDIAIYRLPTLDPVCVGESAHRDWVSLIICTLCILIQSITINKIKLKAEQNPMVKESSYYTWQILIFLKL